MHNPFQMQLLPLQGFPQFNIYSTPLLILVLQGLLLCFLLYDRYYKKRKVLDLLLACILLIMCYHRTTYTIGFMEWYDTFRNTKINYYLINMEMLMGPLIYFYVKSALSRNFKIQKKHIKHFVPWMVFFVIKLGILIYDSQQPGFADNQNGQLVVNFEWPYLTPIVTLFSSAQMLLYLAFSFQLFFSYKRDIQQFFSNTSKKELNWIRNFLGIYSFIFLYGICQIIIEELIVEMSWIQRWWIQFFSALALLYFGVKGYFTDFDFLKDFKKPKTTDGAKLLVADSAGVPEKVEAGKQAVNRLFQEEKIFLDPELNLNQLSKKLALSRSEVSEIINLGFDMNFNDFVNHFRIEEFKKRLQAGDHQQFSLIGLAFECGFNSKATFNRVFKKAIRMTPSDYLQTLQK